MKKEMFIAILLGLLLGGGAAFALVKLPKTFMAAAPATPTTSPENEEVSPAPTAPGSQSLTLEILLPENQSLTGEEEITVSGKTKSSALVAISSPVDEKIAISEDDGAFSERVKLEEGSNEILVVARFNGLEAEKRLIVNYTKEAL